MIKNMQQLAQNRMSGRESAGAPPQMPSSPNPTQMRRGQESPGGQAPPQQAPPQQRDVGGSPFSGQPPVDPGGGGSLPQGLGGAIERRMGGGEPPGGVPGLQGPPGQNPLQELLGGMQANPQGRMPEQAPVGNIENFLRRIQEMRSSRGI